MSKNPDKFYEVLLVDESGWPTATFMVHAVDYKDAVVESLKHIPEGTYIRKIWEKGKLDDAWVALLASMGLTIE